MESEEQAPSDEASLAFSRQVGARLRAVRRQRRLSLDEVERASGGRWSSSAIGAYERGFRNLSLPRLRELADFYNVPMTVLLGEIDLREGDRSGGPSHRLVLDLSALDRTGPGGQVARYASSIVRQRGDWNGRMLSIRRDDVRALCSMLFLEEDELMALLDGWGAVVDATDAPVSGLLDDAGGDGSGVVANGRNGNGYR